MNFLIKLFASGLGTGFMPVAPGTAGSALAALFILVIAPWWVPPVALSLTLIVFFAGIFTAGSAENIWGHDSRKIVIDEVAGMFLSLSFSPITMWRVAAAFFLFRLLDIIKPPPARAAERLPSGWGVMADDMIAGAYTALLMWGIEHWI
jgi:phosphatidylglycerophosphatase A